MSQVNPNSLANLIPCKPGEGPPMAARSVGGVNGVKSRRKRRMIRDALIDILNSDVLIADDAEALKGVLRMMGIDNPTNADAMSLAAIKQALKGDIEAQRYARDTTGERPTQGVEIGNLDDRPLQTMDVSQMTDDQLQRLAAARAVTDDAADTGD